MPSPSRGWPQSPPSLVALLIIAHIACFIAQSFAPATANQLFALSTDGLRAGLFWQPVTYMFLHGNAWHLIGNLLLLFFAGRQIENLLGRKHLLGIYFGGGLLGAIVHLVFTPAGGLLLGASAGAAALLIGFATILPELEITLLLFFVIPVRLRLKFAALGLVVLSVLFLVTGTAPGVSHLAHLGGALLGWAYVQQLGFGRPTWLQRQIRAKKERTARRERMSPAQFINQEIDPILDKISREGMHSLTRAERRTLEQGREKIARKTAGR